MELILSPSWYFTAVYGNLYRLKEYISFKFCHIEPSKKVCAVFSPQEASNGLPYFAFQLVTNYISNRKHYMSVNTTVLPLTTSIERLFETANYQVISASIMKMYISMLRLEDINASKNKFVKQVSGIWKAANDFYKKVGPVIFRKQRPKSGPLSLASYASSKATMPRLTRSTTHLCSIGP